jgi:pilus assembly protein CpaC
MRTRDRVASSLLILLIAVAIPGVVFAADDLPPVRLLVGRSAVLDVGTPISRVSLTSADIADAMVTSPNQLLINGKMPGTISMFVWERSGALRQYEIVVQRDLARLNDQMKRLFPGENIEAQSNGKAIVLSGMVSSKELSGKASTVAAGYVDKAEDVVNLLGLQEGIGSNQVLLRVRFAEVSRSALTELGVSLFTSPTGIKNTIGRASTQQFAAPGFDALAFTKANGDFGSPVTSAEGKFTFGDFLNLFLFNEKYDIGAMIKALQTKGLFQSLAEPNLVAESGKDASFLAGGEIPIPIAQGSGSNTAISVQYKEFGIRLSFTPVVNGNRVHLKVKPEVSTLDFGNAVALQGFRIPALSTRRTETELELMDGQTFAIAGLMNNTMSSTLNKIPGIGDIPILGLLFKSKAAQKNQTELVVMITPHILPRNSPGVTPNLPRQPEPYLPPMPANKTMEAPPPSFPAPRPSDDAAAAQAAATVKKLVPTSNPVPYVAPPQAPAPQTSASQPSRRMTNDEKAAAENARRQQAAESAKRTTRQGESGSRKDRADQERDARLANEQAKKDTRESQEKAKVDAKAAKEQALRDAQAAKEKALRDAKAGRIAGEQAKRQAEVAAQQARRKAELDKEHQKALDEAAAKARAAEAKYQSELKRQQ